MGQNIVIITGTTGAGKSTLAKKISEKHGYGCIVLSEFVDQIARDRGYTDLGNFEQTAGLKIAYFDMQKYLLQEIEKKLTRFPGVVIEGIYDPFLYEKVKRRFIKNKIHLLNIGLSQSMRNKRVRKRESIEQSESKKRRKQKDTSKRLLGLNAIMNHPDAIPIRHENTQQVMNEIQVLLFGRTPRIKKLNISRYRALLQITKRVHKELKRGTKHFK